MTQATRWTIAGVSFGTVVAALGTAAGFLLGNKDRRDATLQLIRVMGDASLQFARRVGKSVGRA